MECVAFAVAACVLNYPGHMSFDSLVQLSEGRSGNFVSFNPPFASMIVAFFDKIHEGTGVLMIVSILLFTSAWAVMIHSLKKTSPLSNLLLMLFLISPITLIYNGIIWKDVIFANLAVFAFAMLISVEKAPRNWKIAIIIILLSMASLVRQQGIIVALIACLALPFVNITERGRSLVARTGTGILFFCGVIVLSKVLFWGATWGASMAKETSCQTPILLLLMYDIAGMVKNDPSLNLSVLARAGVNVPLLKQLMLSQYTPERIDTLNLFQAIPEIARNNLYANVVAQWLHLVRSHPEPYILHRVNVFAWLLGLHDHTKCAPVIVGITADAPDLLKTLHLHQTSSPFSDRLWRYAAFFFKTPVFSGMSYLTGAIASMGWITRIGIRSHVAAISLGSAALLFALTYLFIGIACDLRYLYFMLVASMFCMVYSSAQAPGNTAIDEIK